MIHIILFILNICSILILAALVIDYKPIVCDYTPDAIALINDIIKDLCIGILTSTIFYYIVFFAIDKRREKKIRRYSLSRINLIIGRMQLIIAYYVRQLDISVNDDKLLKLDKTQFSKATTPRAETIQFLCERPIHSNSIINHNGSSEIGLLNCFANDILNFSAQLSDSLLFSQDDMELVQLVSKLKDGGLLSSIKQLHSNLKIISVIALPGYGSELEEFYEQYKTLAKYQNPPTIDTSITDTRNSVPIIVK